MPALDKRPGTNPLVPRSSYSTSESLQDLELEAKGTKQNPSSSHRDRHEQSARPDPSPGCHVWELNARAPTATGYAIGNL